MSSQWAKALHQRQATYALVVGIDQYAQGLDWELNGPSNDALRFVDWLRNTQGVPAQNIKLLLSPRDDDRQRVEARASELGVEIGDASQNSIRQILEVSLPLASESEDLCLYLYWAGHGAVSVTDEHVHYIHCADSSRKMIVALSVNEVLRLLQAPPLSRFRKQICIFDVCAPYRTKRDGNFSYTKFAPRDPDPGVVQTTMLAARHGELARTEDSGGKGLFSSVLFEWLANKDDIDAAALFRRVDARFAELRAEGLTEQRPILCQWNGQILQNHRRSREGVLGHLQPAARKQQISSAWKCAARDLIAVLGLDDGAVDQVLAIDFPGLPSRAALRHIHSTDASGNADDRVDALAQRLRALYKTSRQAAFAQAVESQGIDDDCSSVIESLLESAAHAEYWAKLVHLAEDYYYANPTNEPEDLGELVRVHFAEVDPSAGIRENVPPLDLDEALFRLMQYAQPVAQPSAVDRFLVRLAHKFGDSRLTGALIEQLTEERYQRILNEIDRSIALAPLVPTHLLVDFAVDHTGRLPETVDYWQVDMARPDRLIKGTFAIASDMDNFAAQLDSLLDRIGGRNGCIVEVFMPYERLWQSPDEWRLPGPTHAKRTLGQKVPVAIRWRERALGLAGSGLLEWRDAGSGLARPDASMKPCWVNQNDDPRDINAAFLAGDAAYCCVFDFRPFAISEPFHISPHLAVPIHSGMSFGIWPRKGPVSADFKQLVGDLFAASATLVPENLMNRRRRSSPKNFPDFSHVTLFWDDPDRNPLSSQLLEPRQRETS